MAARYSRRPTARRPGRSRTKSIGQAKTTSTTSTPRTTSCTTSACSTTPPAPWSPTSRAASFAARTASSNPPTTQQAYRVSLFA
ncbi:MAG: hypothetical protein [Microviridae sp.]|nr:MAG: hypothetical protein [Microviridae sp.]